MEDNDTGQLIDSLDRLSIVAEKTHTDKDRLLDAIQNRDNIDGMLRTLTTGRIEAMGQADVNAFWFIALKRHYTHELLCLYEMNQFVTHYASFVRSNTSGWLEKCLSGIYNELLAPLEPTIFYPGAFVNTYVPDITKRDALSPPNMSVATFMRRFIFDTPDVILTRRVLDATKDMRLIQDMSGRSLREYYTKKPRFIAITDTGAVTYTIGDIKRRAVFFHAMLAFYNWLRVYHVVNANAKVSPKTMGETDIRKAIVAVCNTVEAKIKRNRRKSIKSGLSATEIFDIIGETITAKNAMVLLANQVNNTVNSIYRLYADKDPYSVLFSDPLHDSRLTINREKYAWLLPFDEAPFVEQKTRHNVNLRTIKQEIERILVQEATLWANLMIYEANAPKIVPTIEIVDDDDDASLSVSTEKRKKKDNKEKEKKKNNLANDDGGDNTNKTKRRESMNDTDDTETKKRRMGKSVVLSQADNTSILSVLQGSGVLSLYYGNGRCESYQIAMGDNVQLPVDMLEYHILYDEVD